MDRYVDKIVEGDSLIILSRIPDESIDLVVTDPPYWGMKEEFYDKELEIFGQYLDWYEKWVCEVFRVLKPNGSLYVFIPPLEFAETHLVIKKYFCQKQVISWIKPNVLIRQPTARTYFPKVEFVGFYTKDQEGKSYTWNSLARKYGLQKACNFVIEPTIYRNFEEGSDHPTQKPLRLCVKMLYASSNEGDITLDPFCGSGTVCVAAKMLRRRFIGIELKSEYCKISRQRVDQSLIEDLKECPVNAFF
ncbi:MAG: DNA-methyltransferase [Candidatus Heimdallarchaeaceae archaeon]